MTWHDMSLVSLVKGLNKRKGNVMDAKDRCKKEWSDKRQDIELKREGEVCDRHRENEGAGAEW